MIANSVQQLATASRAWIRLELTRIGQRATDFPSLGLPIFGNPFEDANEPREAIDRDHRIAPTAIVLLGLAELIFVTFLVGRTYGGLHPVWQVILVLACAGVAGFSVRLIRLLRARKSRRSPVVTGFTAESPLNPS
jgi:hypothetical protein